MGTEGKPNKTTEAAAGVVGVAFVATWMFDAGLRIIDWISRGQTMMALDPYIHYLVAPWAILIQFLGAVALLFYATRLEHFREVDEAPRIILAYTTPEKPKKHHLWVKLSVGSAILSVVVAVTRILV